MLFGGLNCLDIVHLLNFIKYIWMAVFFSINTPTSPYSFLFFIFIYLFFFFCFFFPTVYLLEDWNSINTFLTF